MSYMKKANIREVQHNLSKILRWVGDGETVVVTRHNRAIANIVPSEENRLPARWPDFAGRLKSIWKETPHGKSVSAIIIDERSERS